MDRDKLRTDISYREGYIEGRKEAIDTIIASLQNTIDALKREIKYDEILLENINRPKKEVK